MSFRDVRAFKETMLVLGYPRPISVDSFRAPNFELVADCLHWLISRLHPDGDLRDDISTEAERVAYLQAVGQVALRQARIKLNLKKLYAADGAAVRELLKLAGLLHKAALAAAQAEEEEEAGGASDVGTCLQALHVAAIRLAAGDIVRHGAALHDALALEAELREARARALASQPEPVEVAAGISEAVAQVEDAQRQLSAALGEVAGAEASLASKLDKRRSELERCEKRLATLTGVRPAYMDEYERLTGELQGLWGSYLERTRNLAFLEAQLEGLQRAEAAGAEAAEKRLRKMQRCLADAELRMLRGEAAVDEGALAATGDAASSSGGSDSEKEERDVAARQDAWQGAGGRGRGGQPVQPMALGGGMLQGGVEQLAAGQVIGSLDAGYDDDDGGGSIDEDTATDGGEVSLAGSSRERGAGRARHGGARSGSCTSDDSGF